MSSPARDRSSTGGQAKRRPSFGGGILSSPVLSGTIPLPLGGGMGGSTSSETRPRRSSSVKRRPSIDPGRLGAMTPLSPSVTQQIQQLSLTRGTYNVVFIGAGNINFGSDEGPWNHSVRLEHKLQTRMNVIGIIDPALDRAWVVLDAKRASFVEKAYKNARLCSNLAEFVAGVKPDEKPHAFIVGSPAQFHGSVLPGADLEVQVLKAFPDAALFIEKPIATAPVASCYALAEYLEKQKTIASVGYMLRYLKVIQHMHQIIEETGRPVMAVVARYVCSYAKIRSTVWWNKSKSLGPIVEQGTHLVDLCRYFGGEAILDSVQAVSTEHYEEAGHLEAMPIDESQIPDAERVPRTTSAIWKFETGATCSFTHALTLQGTKYSTELEVYLDGWQMKVVDLYNDPVLFVRSPESDAEQRIDFPHDDPYFGEIAAWLDAAEAKDVGQTVTESALADDDDSFTLAPDGILSTFRDACGTYALTWAIKEASEKSYKTKRVD